MSAIAGLINIDGQPVSEEALQRMAAAAPPRGLDGTTTWRAGPAGFLRFANATTQEAAGERQPFVNARGAALLFDGRLDNRDELLTLLGPAVAQSRSAPDGQIALLAYEKLGREFVHKLAGDYAIAIHEAEARRLSLFRSPLGWRPLLWTRTGSQFAFATDAKTMVVGLDLDRRMNEGAIAEFLSCRYLTRTETFWSNVFRVEQGGATILENGRIEEWSWHGGPYEDWYGRSAKDHVERLDHLFDQALMATFRNNGAVSAQLSGGLDSSSIVCRAIELYRQGKLDHELCAITARFPGEPHDETEWSGAVERHMGITAKVASSHRFSLEEAQEWSARTYHLPIRPNALDTMGAVVDVMKGDSRRILLTGEGGDDWLNGSVAHWPDLLLKGHWLDLIRHGRSYWPENNALLAAMKTMVIAARPVAIPSHRRALVQPALDWRNPDADWLLPAWRQKVGLEERWRQPIGDRRLKGFAQRSRYVVYSHGNRSLIAETAIAYAESNGIEVRHPFHDLRIARFAIGASGIHMRDKVYKKQLLREAMRGTLPEVVRMRTDKASFMTHTIDAIDSVFERCSARDLLPVRLGWVDGKRIEELHAPFSKWRREGATGELPDNTWAPVWFTIATHIWMQHAFGL